MYWFVTRESERKANQYEHLENELRDCISKYNKKIEKAQEMYDAYSSNVPNFSNSKIPSDYFDSKREELSKKLSNYIKKEAEKKQDLQNAKKLATERKNYYIKKVNAEIEEERQERERELEKIQKEIEKQRKKGGF